MKKNVFRSVFIFFLLGSLFLPSSLNAYLGSNEVEVLRYRNPAQLKYAYAGKLQWDQRKRQWKRMIVVYNQAPEPDKSHPVWAYVKNLKIPNHYGYSHQDMYYKTFYKTGNCSGKTPLTDGKPWFINFDKLVNGRYSKADLRKDWNCPDWQMGNNLINVVNGRGAFRGRALRIHYPKGISGCYSPKHCVNWKPALGGKFKKLYYAYRIKFPKGFDFVKGGKLPGVSGGTANTNGHVPNGADGWTVRMMWNNKGKLVQYVYHPDQPSKYGDVFEWEMDKSIERGKWHSIQTMVLLNTPGKKNGAIKSWLNGKVVLDKKGLRFRDTNKLEIDRFIFASFFGGSGPYWAPRKDEYAFIDEVVLSTRPPFFK
jgi:hypothetical protein